MAYLIGLDVGSQSVKAVVLDEQGRRLALTDAPCSLSFPHSGWAQQEPEDWQRAVLDCIRDACQRAGITATDKVTIGLACQLDGVVAADAQPAALRPAIIWMDRRAVREAAALAQAAGGGAALQKITGLVPDSSHNGPKTMWLREHEPEVFEQARWLASVGAYLNGWLTGVVAHDHANASSSLLYDIVAREYSPRLVAAAGLDQAKLPVIVPAQAVIGTLRRELAEQVGLSAATEVVAGTGDDHGATLGAGGIAPGTIVDVTGTAEPVTAPVGAQPVIDELALLETHAHAVDGTLMLENPGFVSGGSTRWLASVTGKTQIELLDGAAHAPLGAGGVLFLPALSGAMAPRWNEEIRGTFVGLSLDQGPEHLARAVIEGCTFALRDIVDRLGQLGAGADELRVVGGGARSDLWLSVKANVTGRPVRRVLGDCATATGAAMLAGVGSGAFADFEQAVAGCVELDSKVVAPVEAEVVAYAERYQAYRALFDSIEQWTAGDVERRSGAVLGDR